MTKKEIALTIKMLEAYSDHLGNAGCNDTPEEWLADFTRGEIAQLTLDTLELTGDDWGMQVLPDFAYVDLMAEKLKALLA